MQNVAPIRHFIHQFYVLIHLTNDDLLIVLLNLIVYRSLAPLPEEFSKLHSRRVVFLSIVSLQEKDLPRTSYGREKVIKVSVKSKMLWRKRYFHRRK